MIRRWNVTLRPAGFEDSKIRVEFRNIVAQTEKDAIECATRFMAEKTRWELDAVAEVHTVTGH